ncbi:ABC transporter substrate-binding protein [Desulfovibrio sp. OttesenSCG-928-C06]|nr:ABC transporter substrate-binding protein [Desulfovibrio sp. OttesenSCG-928-C06]
MKRLIPALLLLLAIFCAPAMAAEQKSEARQTLEAALDDVFAILDKPEFKDSSKNQPLMQQVKDKIYAVCDFREFSARTVGGRWRSFTPQQQQDFVDAFGELLFETYNSKLMAYDGQRFKFVNEIMGSKGDKVEIQTTLPYEGKEAPVNYRMIKKAGGWKIYDMIIENVGLVQNYRNQFQDILSKQEPEELIATIRTKAKETKDKNHADQ